MDRLPYAIAQLLARESRERKLGPFVLLYQLGQGGFAPVWAARETYGETGLRDAAVKLFALGRQSVAARDRIIREAQALCRVNHLNIVRFYSLVLDEQAGVGGLAMELVAGTSLGKRIGQSGPMPVSDVLRVGITIARALAEVHRAGLLHRDVKPDNIIETEGTYKLIDFGIAGEVDDEEDAGNDTSAGQTVKVARGVPGTPGFVAPEYYHGEPANIAGELYALGATLHTCLVGFPPAATSNAFPWQLAQEVLEGHALPSFAALRATSAPAALISAVERLLCPDPERRHPSASALAEDLEATFTAVEAVQLKPREFIVDLENAAVNWKAAPNPAQLYSAETLERIEKQLARSPGESISDDARTFLRKSHERIRSRRRLSIALPALFVSASVFLAYFFLRNIPPREDMERSLQTVPQVSSTEKEQPALQVRMDHSSASSSAMLPMVVSSSDSKTDPSEGAHSRIDPMKSLQSRRSASNNNTPTLVPVASANAAPVASLEPPAPAPTATPTVPVPAASSSRRKSLFELNRTR